MWLVTDRGFVSVVQHRDDPTVMQVRARLKEDLLALFPDAKVQEIIGADYLYRADVSRAEVAQAAFQAVMNIDYTSHFKDEALKRSTPNPSRSSAYYATWTAMGRMQPIAPYWTPEREKAVQSVLPLWSQRTESSSYDWARADWDAHEDNDRYYQSDDTDIDWNELDFPEPNAGSLAAVGLTPEKWRENETKRKARAKRKKNRKK